MPWKTRSVITMKKEIMNASALGQEGVSALAVRYGVSRKTICKWSHRYKQEGEAGLHVRSRRPEKVAQLRCEETVSRLVKLRPAHPDWDPLKLHAFLRREGAGTPVPSVSAIRRFLRKCGLKVLPMSDSATLHLTRSTLPRPPISFYRRRRESVPAGGRELLR